MSSSNFQPAPFGKYFLIEEVFAGRYTRIFKAKTYGAKGFEKILTLVKFAPEVVGKPKFIEQLTEEFRRVVKITHPNVLPLYDFGNVNGGYFLTQEFLDALSFADVTQKLRESGEPLSVAESLYLVSEALKGLHAIHGKFEGAAQIRHGHIQPRTLVISREGEIKITGLGFERLALLFGVSDIFDTNYFNEKIRRNGQFTLQYDLFLTAMTLFELVAGFPLMSRLPEDSGENRVSEEFLRNHVPMSLLPFFKSAFAGSEEPTFASALDMSVVLQRVLYSEYTDFSAQNLFRRLQKFFDNPKSIATQNLLQQLGDADTRDELIKSSRFQVNLVHREGTEYSSLMADTVALAPDDFYQATQSIAVPTHVIKTADAEPYAHQGKEPSASVSPAGPDVTSKPEKKQRLAWIGILIVVFVILIGILWAVENRKPEPMATDLDRNTQSQRYDLSISSRPEGAAVWFDGHFTGKNTPADFTDLEIGRDYRIMLKQDGFDDYVTVFHNDTGKDQVLDVTLRAE